MTFNIAQKIFGIVLVVLVLMLAVAVYSIRLTARIGDDLDTIALRYMPITEAVIEINEHILEQDIALNRLFVLIHDALPEEQVALSRGQIEALDTDILVEFSKVQRLLREDKETDPRLKNEIEHLERALDAIDGAYKNFKVHGWRLIKAREAADLILFDSLLPFLSQEEHAIHTGIAEVRRSVEEFTHDAVKRAEQHERDLFVAIIVLTGLAAVLGLGFAFFVTRMLVASVRNLVRGTEAVEAGDLDTVIAVSSRDEIGTLTEGFNRMVEGLRLKERIKETFGRYMDPRIVSNLLDAPEFAEPGGERREMTVMFIDLKNFTSISEKLPADDLVRLVNGFFTHMTDAVTHHDGVVDKFMGDSVMAFWGPPFTGPDEHAGLACAAAAEALDRLDDFRGEVARDFGDQGGSLDIDMRIGISTGDMIVGTIGSKASMSFTVMGDPVNLGSRLEGANKAYGTHVLVSGRTRELAGPGVAAREIDLIRVKGKDQPTRVFELIRMVAERPAHPASALDSFRAGLGAYRQRNWDAAEAAFKACLAGGAEDPVAATYLDRVTHFRTQPPPADWDGTWTFDAK